ncbi:MAG: hypothetical protein JXR59_10030 [Desulfuromonadaceae bacterium]|nr:hypothetical protein [Desulfuromonadaceae bacterium]
MTVEELQSAIMALSTEEKQQFILSTLPDLAREAMEDSSFMLKLLPIFLGIVQDGGLNLQQLMQFAALHGGALGGQQS